MFMMMNKVSLKILNNHTQKLCESWKSKIELQGVKPHALDKANKVQINKDFN